MAKVEKCLQLLTDMPFQICELTRVGSIFSDLEVYYPVPVDLQYNKLSLPIINGCFVPEATAKVPPWCPSCEMMMIIDIKCRYLNSLSELPTLRQAAVYKCLSSCGNASNCSANQLKRPF
ncbi:hypothetical protein D917_06396 [Trichinella nativa]|uniref:Uncharacterized protein n=2 Tax=Trichinella TaxID=6333 RepID=A0A1Y3ETP9_9BILA|nr:hypothetical protein D917_06396 [Trichinella nativa]